jgi:hypothetical protein
MNELRVFYEAGVLLALYDALTLARDSGSPAPEWIIGAAALVVGIQLHQGASIGSGPSGNTESQYRLDMIHFRRWSVVKALQASNPAGSVYEKAEHLLKSKFGHGSREVIGKSYRKVEADLQKPETALRYYRGLRQGLELTNTAFPSLYRVSPLGQKPA